MWNDEAISSTSHHLQLLVATSTTQALLLQFMVLPQYFAKIIPQ